MDLTRLTPKVQADKESLLITKKTDILIEKTKTNAQET